MVSDIRKMQQKAVVEITGLNITLNQAAKVFKGKFKVLESRDLSRVITGISVKPKDFTIVEFYTNGMTSGAGTIALSNRYGEFRYIVILNTTGRVRISSTPP